MRDLKAITGLADDSIEAMEDAEKNRINDEIAEELAEFLIVEQSRRN